MLIHGKRLTSAVTITQLPADHSSIIAIPKVITHCSPPIIDTHFHSTLILIGTSQQTNISISTVATSVYWDINTKIKTNRLAHLWLWLCKPTLTSHSSILQVAIETLEVSSRGTWAVNEMTFTATAANIIQVDWTSASTKVSTVEGYCICWYVKAWWIIIVQVRATVYLSTLGRKA